ARPGTRPARRCPASTRTPRCWCANSWMCWPTNQMLAWQGQAWPDAPMEWEVAREHGDEAAGQPGTHWATRLKLNLPRLGTVEARLNLAANQLVLHVVAPDSAAEIGAAADALRQQLSAAGLTLTNLSVDAVAAPGFALPEA
ncbi:flagellar hook-length control protein FliK, partial [Bordetella pertussis]|uniref:flagellar hook-length control protein FliK n=1 Tax=Bordetella pertussis TaxID=520 RepID=UPI001F5215D1